MLRALGIDNTVIVDVFLHKKTQAQIDLQKQAQIDLQKQLEQATADLTARPLLNDSPVLYIETSEQTPPTFLEQMEHTKVEHDNPKTATPPDDTDHTQATPPPPPKKRYEIMKETVFLSSPKYHPSNPSKIPLCTNRDDHLIPLLSQDDFVFKAQLTFHYMYPTDCSFRLYDKNQDFFASIVSKVLGPYQYWLDNGDKTFSLQFHILSPSIYDLKTDESDPSFLSISQKLLIIKRTLNFYNTRNHHHFHQL